MLLSLPRTSATSHGEMARNGRKMAGKLVGSGNESRWHTRRKGKKLGRCTVCSDVILVGSELTALCCDTLEVFLGRGIGVADLEKETLFANGLAMELSDDLLADFAALESTEKVNQCLLFNWSQRGLPSKTNTTAVVVSIPEDSAGTDGIVHKDSTKFLRSVNFTANEGHTGTYGFSHSLRKVRDVEIGRRLITFGLETRIEGLLKCISDGGVQGREGYRP